MPATPSVPLLLTLGRRLRPAMLRPITAVTASHRCLCACAANVTRCPARLATAADLPAIARLQPDAHGGLDDLAGQLPRLTSPSSCSAGGGGFPRRAYVTEDGSGIAAFLGVVLVDSGETAVFANGRARADLLGTGVLARLATAALADLRVGRTLGALCMPRYTREGVASRAGAFDVLESLSQLGFHYNSIYQRSELIPGLAASAAAPSAVSDTSPGELWRLLADGPDAAAGRLLLGGHVLVGRLPMRLTQANLELAGADPLLGPGGRPSVSLGGGNGSQLTGVSFRSQHRGRLGTHLTVTAYAASEELVVSHLLHQMRRASAAGASAPTAPAAAPASAAVVAAADESFYVSLFFPTALSMPRVLNLLHTGPSVLHNLPLSCHPKLNCKLHAVQHRFVGPVSDCALADAEQAIPDDVTNID